MKHLILLALALLVLAACNVPQTSESGTSPQQWLTFEGKENGQRIVLVSGDEEYRSEEALPQLAKILSQRHGFNCTVLFAQEPSKPGIVNPNYVHHIPGLDQLTDADLMVIFTRFRALPDEQMAYIDQYLKNGKPVLAIRTATHAFMFQDTTFESSYRHYGNYYDGEKEWEGGFGRLVLGEKWISHHGKHKHQSTVGLIAPKAKEHPIVNGLSDRDIWGSTDVYGVRLPLPDDAQPIVLGQVTNREGEENVDDLFFGMRNTDRELPAMEMIEDGSGNTTAFNPNDPMMPIAWTKSYQLESGKQGVAFTSTIGASSDLLEAGTRRLLINAAYWLMGLEVPEKSDVALVGAYEPTQYSFKSDQYWADRSIQISEMQ
jgi:hypothetical protein